MLQDIIAILITDAIAILIAIITAILIMAIIIICIAILLLIKGSIDTSILLIYMGDQWWSTTIKMCQYHIKNVSYIIPRNRGSVFLTIWLAIMKKIEPNSTKRSLGNKVSVIYVLYNPL